MKLVIILRVCAALILIIFFLVPVFFASSRYLMSMKKAFTIIRVSAEDQLRGYGPDNQWLDDVLPNAPFLGLEVSETYRRIIQERATSWDREKYEASFREALGLYSQGVIQALLSRNPLYLRLSHFADRSLASRVTGVFCQREVILRP